MCLEMHCPDSLSPPPDASVASFDEELERLRATPPEVLHTEVQMLMQVQQEQFDPLLPEKVCLLEIYLREPDGCLKRLVDMLKRYHELAIAPYWPRIQERLEGDTTALANQLRLSPSAVSAHLLRLKAAELIEPHRSGRKVFYRLSGAGEELLGIFSELE
jgi:DNA-binding transcriptional ArsR family regulator